MEKTTLSRAEKLDRIFGTPVYAVLLAIFCNVLWGSAFPFIKLGYRLFSIDSGNTASIFCFAGVRFMLGSFLVLLGSVLLQNRLLSDSPRFSLLLPEKTAFMHKSGRNQKQPSGAYAANPRGWGILQHPYILIPDSTSVKYFAKNNCNFVQFVLSCS